MLARFRTVIVGLTGAMALLVCACSGPAGSMNKDQLADVRAAVGSLAPGASRDEVLKAAKPANAVPLGSSVVDGISVEEWKIEAFNDSGQGRDLFVRFCYFVDDRLVDTSDRRIDFRADPGLVKRWAGKG